MFETRRFSRLTESPACAQEARSPSTATPPTPANGHHLLRWLTAQTARHQIGGTLAATSWFAAMAAAPWALGKAIDALTHGPTTAVALWAALLAGIFAIQAVASALRYHHANHCFYRGSLHSKTIIGDKLIDIGADVGTKIGAGKAIAHSTHDAKMMGIWFDAIARVIGAIILVTSLVLVSLQASWKLGTLLAVGAPVVTAVSLWLDNFLDRTRRVHREAVGTMATVSVDGVSGLRTLQGFGGQKQYLHQYRHTSKTLHQAGTQLGVANARLRACQTALLSVLLTSTMWLGAVEVTTGNLGLGDLIAFCGWTALLTIPLKDISGAYSTYRSMRTSLTKLDTLLKVTTPHSQSHPRHAHTIPLESLTDHESKIVIERGVMTGIVAARSVEADNIAQRLAHVPADTRSPVTVGATRMNEWPLAHIRQHIAYCGPRPELTAGTLRSQVDPTGQRSDADCRDALAVAAAEDVLDETRGGLDERITERGRSLSGGQRQRVALARALLTERPVLVLVNPTSAVDSVTENRIADALRIKRQGLTTVIATTSPMLLDQCDVVYHIRDRTAEKAASLREGARHEGNNQRLEPAANLTVRQQAEKPGGRGIRDS